LFEPVANMPDLLEIDPIIVRTFMYLLWRDTGLQFRGVVVPFHPQQLETSDGTAIPDSYCEVYSMWYLTCRVLNGARYLFAPPEQYAQNAHNIWPFYQHLRTAYEAYPLLPAIFTRVYLYDRIEKLIELQVREARLQELESRMAMEGESFDMVQTFETLLDENKAKWELRRQRQQEERERELERQQEQADTANDSAAEHMRARINEDYEQTLSQLADQRLHQ